MLLIVIYRVGSHIVLPVLILINLTDLNAKSSKGILGLFDTFAGGAFSQASIFALGIMPYISASIFMQLMTILVPQFQKIQKEGDSGSKKINQWTRYLTVVLPLFRHLPMLLICKRRIRDALIACLSSLFLAFNCIVLTAGTLFVMWLGEKITDKGLGNGTSLIIMIGILARLPQSFIQELAAKSSQRWRWYY